MGRGKLLGLTILSITAWTARAQLAEADWFICVGSDFGRHTALIAGPFESSSARDRLETQAQALWQSRGLPATTVQCPIPSTWDDAAAHASYAQQFLKGLGFSVTTRAAP